MGRCRPRRRSRCLGGQPHLQDLGEANIDRAAIDGVPPAPPDLRMLRSTLWAGARVISVMLLLTTWEVVARSGIVTPFQLPALSNVLERIWKIGRASCRERV